MIKPGDHIPDATLLTMTADGPKPVATREVFAGRTVVLFATPGAFTPVCSRQLPGFVKEHDALKAKGVDLIACTAVNDSFVLAAWAKAHQVEDRILMLADGNADFAKALGLSADVSRYGMGVRSRRYSMVVEDGVVKTLNLDNPGEFAVSSAEATLCQL
jgi:peroxiredoxin